MSNYFLFQQVVSGDITSTASLKEHFEGCDAVVSCLGAGTLRNVTLYSESIKIIVAAMRETSIKKLVAMTSWGSFCECLTNYDICQLSNRMLFLLISRLHFIWRASHFTRFIRVYTGKSLNNFIKHMKFFFPFKLKVDSTFGLGWRGGGNWERRCCPSATNMCQTKSSYVTRHQYCAPVFNLSASPPPFPHPHKLSSALMYTN